MRNPPVYKAVTLCIRNYVHSKETV